MEKHLILVQSKKKNNKNNPQSHRFLTASQGHTPFYSRKEVIYGDQQQEDTVKTTKEGLHFALFLQQKMNIFFKL